MKSMSYTLEVYSFYIYIIDYYLDIFIASETSEETNLSFYEEEESRRYLSLLNQELKQKIKNHSQFIAARKKRGIVREVKSL